MQMVDILRWGLFFSCGGMLVLAVLFLGQRRLAPWQKLLWGLLALGLPLLGPFLVIYCRPGEHRAPPGRRVTRLRWESPNGSQGVRRVK